jgi:DNA end-binding protein Ku
MTDEELEALAPRKSREIDLRLFVDRDSLNPLYFERSYFLAPGADSGKAYRLLGAVMESSRRAGIASFVMRDNEYLIAIFADAGLLRAETLRFHDEVRSTGDVGLPQRTTLDASAVKRMARAVDALAEKAWDPSELTDPHAAVRELAQRKYEQKEDVVSAGTSAPEGGGQVIDLMEVLRQSLAQNQLTSSRGSSGSRRSKSNTPSARRPKAAKKASRRAKTSSAARRRSPSRPKSKAGPSRKKSAARTRLNPEKRTQPGHRARRARGA